jgi:histidinol-phosphatase (PHP family)
VIDYHVHLWPHGQRDRAVTVEELASYCELAAQRGVGEIAVTEHLFRFRGARLAVGDFWNEPGADPHLAAVMAAYWDDHAQADLDHYVETVVAAQAAGLPVKLGLEVDHYPGRMGQVQDYLAGYPFDVLLGSVHWLGQWLFDYLEDPQSMAEWGRRGIEAAWTAYVEAVEELAGSGTCDVLAHPDLVKVAGLRPADPGRLAELEARLAAAAAASGLAAEASSAGWRKPAGEMYPSTSLLQRFHEAGVPVTAASDTHGRHQVGFRSGEVRMALCDAGYREVCGYDRRRRYPVPIGLP